MVFEPTDEVAARAERALIRRYALGPRVEYEQPPSSLRCTKILDTCICDACSDIKSNIQKSLPPRRSDPKYITPTRGPLDTVGCGPAPFMQHKIRKWRPKVTLSDKKTRAAKQAFWAEYWRTR